MAWIVGRGDCPEVAMDAFYSGVHQDKTITYAVAAFEKDTAYCLASRWWDERRDTLASTDTGKRLALNALDLTHVIVDPFVTVGGKRQDNDALAAYNERYGPTPPHGRLMFAITIPSLLYTVYLQDTNGHRRVVGGDQDLSEAAADARIKAILDSHSKPHKVDYHKIGYTNESKAKVLAEHHIEL